MENTEVIKALRCGGHNMMFTYCNKVDCPFCQFSYYDKLHKCNIQELGAKAADALEAAEKRIAELEKQIPKEGKWIEHRTWGFSYASPLITNYHCSICDHEESHNKYHYCPNCGAKMKIEQEKTNEKNDI